MTRLRDLKDENGIFLRDMTSGEFLNYFKKNNERLLKLMAESGRQYYDYLDNFKLIYQKVPPLLNPEDQHWLAFFLLHLVNWTIDKVGYSPALTQLGNEFSAFIQHPTKIKINPLISSASETPRDAVHVAGVETEAVALVPDAHAHDLRNALLTFLHEEISKKSSSFSQAFSSRFSFYTSSGKELSFNLDRIKGDFYTHLREGIQKDPSPNTPEEWHRLMMHSLYLTATHHVDSSIEEKDQQTLFSFAQQLISQGKSSRHVFNQLGLLMKAGENYADTIQQMVTPDAHSTRSPPAASAN